VKPLHSTTIKKTFQR